MPIVINGSGTVTGISVGGLPDGIVDTDMLANNAVTSAKATGRGITEADQWRLTASVQGDVDPITGTWERNDNTGFDKIGTGLTQSSGVFSFPSTGIWQILTIGKNLHNDANMWGELMLYTTVDNGSNWIKQSEPGGSVSNFGTNGYTDIPQCFLFDVSNTTNCKCRFAMNQNKSTAYLVGHSDYNTTHITFIRLGDT